jgi:hypothetical protein
MNPLTHSKAAIRPFLLVSLLACAISLAQEVPRRPPGTTRPPGIPHELVPKKPTPTPTPGGILPGLELPGTGIATEPIVPSNLKDFDVWAPSSDRNGFPLNPKWGRQVVANSLPTPKDSCPVNEEPFYSDHWTSSPQWPNCTSYPVTFNGGDFSLTEIGAQCYHINFMPVTYEGHVAWNGKGPWPFDRDYTFNVFRDDKALFCITEGGEEPVHVEFDERETVDQWDNTDSWWKEFHYKGDDQKQSINGHPAIVIGLLNLDASHRGKPELHPVYVMFVLVDQNLRLRQTKWAFFVRNWGNEGSCGERQMYFPDREHRSIKVQIPGAATLTSPPEIWKGARKASDLSSMSWSAEPNERGMELRFVLLKPDKQSWFLGDLTFQGAIPATVTESEDKFTPRFEALPATVPEEDKLAPRLREQIDKLPESSRKELRAKLQSVVPVKQGVRVSGKINTEPAPAGEKLTFKSPTKVESKGDLVQLKKDSVGELTRRKQLEVLRKFFAERGVQVDLPPEK